MKVLAFVLSIQVVLCQYQQSCPNGRFCKNGAYYMEYDLRFFEGSNPGAQFGAIWKEVVTSVSNNIFVKSSTTSPNPLLQAFSSTYAFGTTLTGSQFQFNLNQGGGSVSKAVTRIRRIWQFPNVGSTIAESVPATNLFWQVLYNWPASTDANMGYSYATERSVLGSQNADWFIGDVVSFPQCFYIVRMVTKGSGSTFTKYYTFEQMLMSLQFDMVTQTQHTLVYSNFIQTYSLPGSTGTITTNDIPFNLESIFYQPSWCSFYWLTQGVLVLKVDKVCLGSNANNPLFNPCGTATPLFPTAGAAGIIHSGFQVPSVSGNLATFIDQVWVYGFMYFSVVGYNNQIFKAMQTNLVAGTITVQTHWYLPSLYSAELPLQPLLATTGSSNFLVSNLNSLDNYGFFIQNSNTYNNGLVWQYVIDLQNNADGTKYVNPLTNGYVENLNNASPPGLPVNLLPLQQYVPPVAPATTSTTPNNYNQKLYQQEGAMVDSRPLYAAQAGGNSQDYTSYRNVLYLVSSVNNVYMTVSQQTSASVARPIDFWNYNLIVNPNQMFLMMPGLNTDDTQSPSTVPGSTVLNWNYQKVAIFDVNSKDEIIRWQMTDCGDGFQNNTAFEICDYAASPPAWTLVYPNTALPSQANALSVTSRGIFYWPSSVTLGYPGTAGDNNYHQCTTSCQALAINLCGDGAQSNGPSMTDGREACDDGNTNSGDGCSSDCTTIETGWECPVWGKPCRLLCGNGVLDPAYTRINPITLVTETFTEECDLGNSQNAAGTYGTMYTKAINGYDATSTGPFSYVAWNHDFGAGNYQSSQYTYNLVTSTQKSYLWACTNNCEISDRYYWSCNANTATTSSKPASTCAYTCGNKWLDNIGATDKWGNVLTEQCDLLVQQYSGQISGGAAPANTGYTYTAVTSITGASGITYTGASSVTAAVIAANQAAAVLTPGVNPNWITYPTQPYRQWTDSTNTFQQTYMTYDQSNIGCDITCKIRKSTATGNVWPTCDNPALTNPLTSAANQNCWTYVCPTSNAYTVQVPYTTGTPQSIYQNIQLYNNKGNSGSNLLLPTMSWYGPMLFCSDRIQDGVYDGRFYQINRAAQTPSVKMDSSMWNSYILYGTYPWTNSVSQTSPEPLNTNDRLWEETCDNNGDITHGCDVLGQITTGWSCRHYYVAIRDPSIVAQTEVPWFRSLCTQTAAGSLSPTWRMLFGEDLSGFTDDGWISHNEAKQLQGNDDDEDLWSDIDILPSDRDDHSARYLWHSPLKGYYWTLPSNTFVYRNLALYQNPKLSLNGQIRMAESPDSVNAQAIIFSYPQPNTASPADYVYVFYKTSACVAETPSFSYSGLPLSNCGTITSVPTAITTGSLSWKQRNTFGPYVVVNNSLQTIRWMGFQTTGGTVSWVTNIFTSLQWNNIEFLGNFEFYYYGYMNLMLARLSDGFNFQFFRMSSTFDTQAATENGVPLVESATTIQQNDNRLQMIVPGTVSVPPVFVNDVGVFYYKDLSGVGWLMFYKFSTFVEGFVLQTTLQTDTQTDLNFQKYTLVRVATGVIFKASSDTTFNFYKTSDYSWSVTSVTWSYGTATVGAAAISSRILLQPRDNPKTYSATTIPQIFAFENNNYMYLMTWDGTSTLTVTTSIVIPCSTTQSSNTGGKPCYSQFITLSPEWIDVGYTSFVVLSPINCAAQYPSTPTTGMSARFYNLSTVPDVDTNNDGLVDGTQTILNGSPVAGTGTGVNYFKGWSCWDLSLAAGNAATPTIGSGIPGWSYS